MYTRRCPTTRGASLVELLLYTGLLTIILVVLYQLFAIASYQKLRDVVADEFYINADRMVDEFQGTIVQATSVTEPTLGNTSATLRLNGGTTIYQINGDGALEKTEGGLVDVLTNHAVIVRSISFSHWGPSTASPTLKIMFTLEASDLVEGRVRQQSFQTAVAVR